VNQRLCTAHDIHVLVAAFGINQSDLAVLSITEINDNPLSIR
jgi:hypothetical protein